MFNQHREGANMTVAIIRLPVVKARTGICRTSLYEAIKEGTFPAPVKLGPRAVGWLECDITAWIESRPKAGCATPAKNKGAQ
jgi:prophage regulatory protein